MGLRQLNSIPLMVLSGAYNEMGHQYGAALRTKIERNVELYLMRFTQYGNLSEGQVHDLGTMYREMVHAYNCDIADMLDGVAQGASIAPSLIHALNARTEILYAHAHLNDACTAVSVLNTHTNDHHLLIGQNWDWHPEQRDVALVLATRDPSGFSVVTLTEAGMLAKSGFNSAGIGVMANLLMSSQDAGGRGVPYHVLLRGILQSSSMAYALRAAADHPRTSSGNFLIGDQAGESIDLEIAPEDFGYLLPVNGLIAHANHFMSTVGVVDKRKSHSALSLIRPERARHLLADRLLDRTVTVDDLKMVFQDHYSYPNGICRHVDPLDPPEEQNCSVASVVIDLNDQVMDVTLGNPCDTPYQRISLQDLYSERGQH